MAENEPPSRPHTDTPTILEEVLVARDSARNNHYAAIGMVAANWAYFEAVVDDWAIRLAGTASEIGICFTAQIGGSRAKLDALISLAGLRGTNARLMAELHDFAKDTQPLSVRRNRHVHDVWFLDEPDTPRRLEVTAKKTLRLLYIDVPTDRLLQLAAEISRHTGRLDDLGERILVEPPASPDKSARDGNPLRS
jgi:hypothetical protein